MGLLGEVNLSWVLAPQLDAQAAPPEGPGENSLGPGDPMLFSGLRGHSTHGYTDPFRQT